MRPSSERRLEALESAYRDLLLSALRRCAAGVWGLFGHNDAAIGRLGKATQSRLLHPSVSELLELGSQIERMRRQLGYSEPFQRHARLLHLRSSHESNTPGEPKLARQWLDELQQ